MSIDRVRAAGQQHLLYIVVVHLLYIVVVVACSRGPGMGQGGIGVGRVYALGLQRPRLVASSMASTKGCLVAHRCAGCRHRPPRVSCALRHAAAMARKLRRSPSLSVCRACS